MSLSSITRMFQLYLSVHMRPVNFFRPHGQYVLRSKKLITAANQEASALTLTKWALFQGEIRVSHLHGWASGVTNECGQTPRPALLFLFITRAARALSTTCSGCSLQGA